MANYSRKPIFFAALLFNLSLTLAAGTQFITGPCTSDADCADSCCGFNTGKCAGPIIAQERDGGCGFGNPEPNDIAAVAIGFTGSAAMGAPPGNVQANTTLATVIISSPTASAVSGTGTQFITGPCTSDADCADSCCGFNTGKCAGPIIAQERDGGCGFGNPEPNDIAAVAIGFTGSAAMGAPPGNVQASTTLATVIISSPTASAVSGTGTQFITGPCTSDADCADSCCGFNTGKCAGPIIAQERDGGCGFGNPEPNDIAAVAIGFTGSAAMGAPPGNVQASTTLATVVISSPTASAVSGTGAQFITGPCTSDADCAAGCCGFHTGLCAGPIVALQRDGGCGFGDAQPNSNAAQKLGFTGGITG